MKCELHFPDWYGVSWDAFWDAIIAVVEMPDSLGAQRWQGFAHACPRDMQILRQIIDDYHQEKPGKQLLLAP
jgi:ribonuclease inhibitor